MCKQLVLKWDAREKIARSDEDDGDNGDCDGDDDTPVRMDSKKLTKETMK